MDLLSEAMCVCVCARLVGFMDYGVSGFRGFDEVWVLG